MDTADLHRRAVDLFDARVRLVRDDQWQLPTPCSDWDVRALVNHLVYENVWTPPMFEGRTIAEVGNQFEGDLLGENPVRAWAEAAPPAVAAVSAPGALERTVHLSYGDESAREYAMQLFADHVIHSWDLARAIGGDEALDPELVDALTQWYADREHRYRSGGAVGPRVDVPEDADPQTRLLAAFGRAA